MREQLEQLLKDRKINYNIEPSQFSDSYEYEIFIGSISAFIILDKGRDGWAFEFTSDNNLYHSSFWEDTEGFSLEEELDNLIDYTKNYNKVKSKISSKIHSIIEICEENDLEYTDFIDIKFDFE